MEQTPSIGRVAHYVSLGSLDGKYPPTCRSAIITEVREIDGTVGLAVLNPTGLFFHPLSAGGCAYDNNTVRPRGGSWHWPERTDG